MPSEDSSGERRRLGSITKAGSRHARRLMVAAAWHDRYRDKWNLATIGRSKAVAEVGPIRLGGAPAWVLWLMVHLFYLIGFQNRLLVLLRWTISFATRGRGARLIGERGPAADPDLVARDVLPRSKAA